MLHQSHWPGVSGPERPRREKDWSRETDHRGGASLVVLDTVVALTALAGALAVQFAGRTLHHTALATALSRVVLQLLTVGPHSQQSLLTPRSRR